MSSTRRWFLKAASSAAGSLTVSPKVVASEMTGIAATTAEASLKGLIGKLVEKYTRAKLIEFVGPFMKLETQDEYGVYHTFETIEKWSALRIAQAARNFPEVLENLRNNFNHMDIERPEFEELFGNEIAAKVRRRQKLAWKLNNVLNGAEHRLFGQYGFGHSLPTLLSDSEAWTRAEAFSFSPEDAFEIVKKSELEGNYREFTAYGEERWKAEYTRSLLRYDILGTTADSGQVGTELEDSDYYGKNWFRRVPQAAPWDEPIEGQDAGLENRDSDFENEEDTEDYENAQDYEDAEVEECTAVARFTELRIVIEETIGSDFEFVLLRPRFKF